MGFWIFNKFLSDVGVVGFRRCLKLVLLVRRLDGFGVKLEFLIVYYIRLVLFLFCFIFIKMFKSFWFRFLIRRLFVIVC